MKTFKKVIPFLTAALLVVSLAACSTANNGAKTDPDTSSSASAEQTKAFPKFQGTDFDGNAVDESMFSQNDVTVLNFWFNDCSVCVDEMPALEKFNQALREKGAELVGVNVEAGGDDNALKEAKKILAKQGAAYKNIALKGGKEIDDYLSKIYGFPTTVLVDRNGNIIGEPILGAIDDEARMADIMKMVEEAAAGRPVSSSVEKTENDDISALIEEENAVFTEHMDIWGKVLDSIPKEKAAQVDQAEYVKLLKEQINNMKDSFTENELKLLNEDLQKIEEIKQQIQDLEDAE